MIVIGERPCRCRVILDRIPSWVLSVVYPVRDLAQVLFAIMRTPPSLFVYGLFVVNGFGVGVLIGVEAK